MTDYGIDTGMVFYMWQEMDKGCANLLFENTGQGWLFGPLALLVGVVLLLVIGGVLSRWVGADKGR